MSDHERLLIAINDYVDGEVEAGHIIDVNATAIHLSSQFPQSGMTLDEIVHNVEDATIHAHGVLYSAPRNGGA